MNLLGSITWPYRLAAVLAGTIALLGLVWIKSAEHQEAKYAAQAIKVDTTRAAIAPKIEAKHEVAVVKIRTVTKTIIKEVPTYVQVTDCPMPGGFRVLHDAAANGEIPDASRIPDAASVPAQDVASTIAENYGTCRETAQRLTDLQTWVREQQVLN